MALMQDAFVLVDRFKKGIIILALYVLVISVIAFPFTGMLIGQVQHDLIHPGANATDVKLVQTQPLELIMLEFKMSLVFGVVAALPLVFAYLYLFARAQKLGERLADSLAGRFTFNIKVSLWKVVLAVLIAIVLFVLGCAYSYVFMLPVFFDYLIEMARNAGIANSWKVSEFINFAIMTTLIFGLVFEMPLVMTILVRSGIVPLQLFKKYRRHAYIIILIASAIITASPDVISQIIIAIPLIIFYEISLLIISITGRFGVKLKEPQGQ